MDRVDYQPLIIQDLLNWHRTEEIELNPWYQRRAVWKNPQKSYLINTLFESKPVPAIYIRHAIDMEREKSIREVVDGQQRIRAILDYVKDEFSARHPSDRKRKRYSQLSPEQRRHFVSTGLSVGYLLGASDADVIDIFGRINSVSKTLNAQEKLNAVHSGEFKQFCLEIASTYVGFWKDNGVFSATSISRMEEVRFVADVTLNLLSGLQDFTPKKIADAYKKHDEVFEEYEALQKRWQSVMDRLLEADPNTIKETIFNRTPLLFSLILALDANSKIKQKRLEKSLRQIDAIFSDETVDSAEVANFRQACSSSTQRIAQRRIRQRFIGSHL